MTVRRTKLDVEQYDLGSLRLYREDLRAIATAAGEAGDLAIRCDGFEATSPDDFGDAMPEKLRRVTIKAGSPDRLSTVEIRLSPREATVQLTEPDTLLAGIVSRVRLICEPRRRRLRSVFGRGGGSISWTTLVIAAACVVFVGAAGLLTAVVASAAEISAEHGHYAGGLSAVNIGLFISLGTGVYYSRCFTLSALVLPVA